MESARPQDQTKEIVDLVQEMSMQTADDAIKVALRGRTGGDGSPNVLSFSGGFTPGVDSQQREVRVQLPFTARQKRNIFKQWSTKLNETDYDKYLIPKMEENKAVEVMVSIMISRVHSVSHSSMDYGIEMYYREHWHDYRLAFNPGEYDNAGELNLPMAALNYVWKPDTYFLNAISGQTVKEDSVTHRAFFRLNSTGHVHYSRKISLTADCPMDLSMYPFDKQYCRLILGTYSHSSDDLIYNWAKQRGHDVELKNPIRMTEYYAEKPRTSRKKKFYTTGSFDSLELCLTFKRSAGFCILQIFIPATAVVMSSWVALWMAEDTSFSDVLAVILAIIFLAFSYNSVMPRVSYVKLLDLYMSSCFVFVFLSLAKLVIIKYFCKKWAKEGTHSSEWFLAQLAGISMAQQQTAAAQDDGESGTENDRRYSNQNGGVSSVDEKPSTDAQEKAPKRHSVNRLAEPERRKTCILMEASESSEDYESALEKSSLIDSLNKSMHTDASIATDEFLEMMIQHSDTDERDQEPQEKRKLTFLGLEAFTTYFSKKHKRKQWKMERRMKYLRYFNVVTQLALPIGFGAFFIFLLFVYPNLPQRRGC